MAPSWHSSPTSDPPVLLLPSLAHTQLPVCDHYTFQKGPAVCPSSTGWSLGLSPLELMGT